MSVPVRPTDGLSANKPPILAIVAVAEAVRQAQRALKVQRGVRVLKGVFYIQNVKVYDVRLETWLRRFNGIASKYLDNYLGWRRLLERYRDAISPALRLHEAVGLTGIHS